MWVYIHSTYGTPDIKGNEHFLSSPLTNYFRIFHKMHLFNLDLMGEKTDITEMKHPNTYGNANLHSQSKIHI